MLGSDTSVPANDTSVSFDAAWHQDPETRQRVRFSRSQGRWIDDKGRPVRAPRRAGLSAAGGASSSQRAAGPSRRDQAVDEVVASLSQMTVTAQQPPFTRTAGYSATAIDNTSGLETSWNVTPGFLYQDPTNANQTRAINTKYVNITGRGRAHDPASLTARLTVFQVIEVLLVPPDAPSEESTVSQITAAPGQEPSGPRLRRFVIVEIMGDQVRALPIKTYNGMGVTGPGVIKAHHSIIYTGHRPPTARSNESTILNGQVVDTMQPQPIRVKQYDLMTALDPMSRLDYGAEYRFNGTAPNIRFFGRVHDDSLACLYAQWHVVHHLLANPAGIKSETSGAFTVVPSRPLADPRPATTPQLPEDAEALFRRLALGDSGPCTDADLERLLQYLCGYAQKRGWRPPSTNFTAQQRAALAQNSRVRAEYIQILRNQWTADVEAEESSDSS